MTPGEIAALMDGATVKLGGAPEFALVLINEASAYPHGSHQPQTLRDGSTILMDVGCTVYGYQSDISRTWVMGQPEPQAAQGLGDGQERPGDRARHRQSGHARGRHR